MTRSILSAVMLMLLLSSCNLDCLEGRGDLKTETRKLKSFSKIELKMNAKVILIRDSVQSVRVEAQPNVLQVLNTDVSGKWLYIDVDGCLFNHKPITVYISTPSLEALEIDGNGTFESKGNFSSDKVELSVNGSGTINLGLNTNEVSADIRGSGNINLSGSARKFNIDIAGSGDVNGQDMPAEACNVDVKGSGNCRVFAIGKLNVDIAGSGNVYYKGKPDIS
ncbi:MAG: head GIN domain-containing protein, partial [Bacteroidota bacterium]|nr:head GIN domain-containing protein [Bacteroidota bacterium]